MTRIVHITDPRTIDPTSSAAKITTQCCVCGRMGATLADLDGEPFVSYYHSACLPEDEPREY